MLPAVSAVAWPETSDCWPTDMARDQTARGHPVLADDVALPMVTVALFA